MGDLAIEEMENRYEQCTGSAHQEYLEYSFYEFLFEMKEACMVPKPYTLPGDITTIKRFWEIG